MDHPPDAGASAGLEQVPGPVHVHLHCGSIVDRHRAIDTAKMHHDLDPLQCCLHGGEVAQIGHPEIDLLAGWNRQVKRAQLMAFERWQHIRTETPGRTGDCYAHVNIPTPSVLSFGFGVCCSTET